MARTSQREDEFAALWHTHGPDGFPLERQYRFHPTRRWQFDFAYPPGKVAIEIEGVTYFGPQTGRHQTAKGLAADAEKYNAAIECGWRVLRYTQVQVKADPIGVIEQIERVLLSAVDTWPVVASTGGGVAMP